VTPRIRRGLLVVGLGLLGVVVLALTALAVYSSVELARFARAETRRATFIYGAGQSLAPGVHVGLIDLSTMLARLGYTETRSAPAAPGQFRRAGGTWDIFLREERAPIRIEVRDDRIRRVLRDGRDVDAAVLEGEVLTGGSDQRGEDHRPIRLADAPKVLVDAIVATEDRHPRARPRGVGQSAGAASGRGREHDHPAAREEPTPDPAAEHEPEAP